jgi:hypothetical protein
MENKTTNENLPQFNRMLKYASQHHMTIYIFIHKKILGVQELSKHIMSSNIFCQQFFNHISDS